MPAISNQQITEWRTKIQDTQCEHTHSLGRQLGQIEKLNRDKTTSKSLSEAVTRFEKKLSTSIKKVDGFKAAALNIQFPEQLPISQRKQEIAELIKENQVVIIAGETGSGKTTQLPKICLSLGLGCKGLIGHTQPRRIAARTVADRIASELKSPLGDTVGYQVRFNDVSSEKTQIKLMTDGVLLAEFQRDRFLSRYEVIIIDEAHERSLNIDFLLGLLKPLCKRRPDLKIIITSATIDLEKFSHHFKINGKQAPIIEVSGRTYPVETLYQAPKEENTDLADLITDTVKQVIRNETKGMYKASGDILIFCAGEREIRDAALALNRAQLSVDVLPLYSRLSVSEQNKVFKTANRRKVVLATNVAETSITVPGIAYVIDPGTARVSRYSFRSKVQRLPIEAISQASANQRMGRCGRVANGVCIRLYSEEDFNSRPEFTSAEIVRSNLASVILKMQRIGIRDVAKFDFIDRPDNRLLNDGYKLLQELNAIDSNRKLTKIGKQMSDLPVDPRYARILVSAVELDCLQDALVLISALSIQDPRERPADKKQAADQAHKELTHHQSDFFSYLHLWQSINDNRDALSNSKFKVLCHERFWSVTRIFEWRELYHQLSGLCKELGWKSKTWNDIDLGKIKQTKSKKKQTSDANFDGRYENIHRALLTGLVSNIATKDIDDEYTATRGRKIHLFPGSAQAKLKPKWLICAQLLETSRLFAHTVAQIKPEWVIDSATHLCKYNYSSPHFHARSGSIKAKRKTLLYGLILRDKEAVNYGPINPDQAHEIFIQQALVEANYRPGKQNSFFDHNQKLINDIEKLETKTRRRNLLVSEQTLYEFYSTKIPKKIHNRNSFEQWLKQKDSHSNDSNNKRLKLNREQLLSNQVENDAIAQFPDSIEVHGKKVSIIYKFNPGQAQDGVTMVVPISVLSLFPNFIGDWLVPGLLREKCIALIKTLPKQYRRHFAPAADAIDRLFNNLIPGNEALNRSLAAQLFHTFGIKIDPEHFDLDKLDHYYLMNYRIMDVDGSLVDEERDLTVLKQRYADSVQESVHANNAIEKNKLEKHNIEQWDFGPIAPQVEYQHQGMTVTAYPCLVVSKDQTTPEKQSLSLLITDRITLANYYSHDGLLALALRTLSNGNQRQAAKYLKKDLFANKSKAKNTTNLSNLASQLKKVSAKPSHRGQWVDEVMLAGIKQSCFDGNLNTVRNSDEFHQHLEQGGKNWVSVCMEFEQVLSSALSLRDQLFESLNSTAANTIAIDQALEEMKAQLYQLFESRLLRYTSLSQLKQYPRYLRAIESRIEKLKFVSKTATEEAALSLLQNEFNNKVDQLGNADISTSPDYVYLTYPKLHDFALSIEEWRVSLFAQHLKTLKPVSQKRLTHAWKNLLDELNQF